jgi:hypothetical protein
VDGGAPSSGRRRGRGQRRSSDDECRGRRAKVRRRRRTTTKREERRGRAWRMGKVSMGASLSFYRGRRERERESAERGSNGRRRPLTSSMAQPQWGQRVGRVRGATVSGAPLARKEKRWGGGQVGSRLSAGRVVPRRQWCAVSTRACDTRGGGEGPRVRPACHRGRKGDEGRRSGLMGRLRWTESERRLGLEFSVLF